MNATLELYIQPTQYEITFEAVHNTSPVSKAYIELKPVELNIIGSLLLQLKDKLINPHASCNLCTEFKGLKT